jgi:hypothetical protein
VLFFSAVLLQQGNMMGGMGMGNMGGMGMGVGNMGMGNMVSRLHTDSVCAVCICSSLGVDAASLAGWHLLLLVQLSWQLI